MYTTEISEVIQENNAAARYIVDSQVSIDNDIADLVLRNTAVVADRLSPEQFERLGKQARGALALASSIANEIKPLSKNDLAQHPTETNTEHKYRTEVTLPLHQLQAVVSLGEYDPSNPKVVSSIKMAVWLGSTAFEKVITDPFASELHTIKTTTGYFGGNSRAAARRAKRLQVKKD